LIALAGKQKQKINMPPIDGGYIYTFYWLIKNTNQCTKTKTKYKKVEFSKK